MNGISWLTSSTPAPTRARMSATPTLKKVCSASAGRASSQYQVKGSPNPSTITISTTIEMAICCSSIST